MEAAFDEFVGQLEEAPLEVEEEFRVRDRNIEQEFEALNEGLKAAVKTSSRRGNVDFDKALDQMEGKADYDPLSVLFLFSLFFNA